MFPGVVQGKVNTPTAGDWSFDKTSSEIPGAACQPSPPQNNNTVAVWLNFASGWSLELKVFKGITSTMTDCDAASGSGAPSAAYAAAAVGRRGRGAAEKAGKGKGKGEQVIARQASGHRPLPAATSIADPGRVRHLTYHVYPHAADHGAIWRWNVEHLRRRISLFNGRRVVAVATGPETDPPRAVREALGGCGCEFIVVANNPGLKEAATFPLLLQAVSGFTGPEHATFYGHTKGVTSRSWAPGARPWAETMYEACLDYWPQVRRLLVDHPLAGPFKRNNCGFPGSRSAWHYSGSFRWTRNTDLFARDWREIDLTWTGSESHPGLHFTAEEAACVVGEFNDDGIGLYLKETWDDWAANVVADWRAQHHADRWQPLLLTCVLTSHCKPRYVHDAIASVLAQSTPDWQLVVIDSGPLIEAGEFDRYKADPRILVTASGETPDMRGRIGLQARAINEATRRGLVLGDLVCYLSDDDVYYPGAFAAFLAAARSAPWESAWYGSVDRMDVRRDGDELSLGELLADVPGGIAGVSLDRRADGMQVCHRRELLPRAAWPEEAAAAWHADGLFLERLGNITTIQPLGAKIGRHRHTADSTFTRSSDANEVACANEPSPAPQ